MKDNTCLSSCLWALWRVVEIEMIYIFQIDSIVVRDICRTLSVMPYWQFNWYKFYNVLYHSFGDCCDVETRLQFRILKSNRSSFSSEGRFSLNNVLVHWPKDTPVHIKKFPAFLLFRFQNSSNLLPGPSQRSIVTVNEVLLCILLKLFASLVHSYQIHSIISKTNL